MESNSFTQQQIEETLNSVDGIAKADMPPFFYTRLQAKLAYQAPLPKAFRLGVNKSIASMATLSLLIILNIAAINYYVNTNAEPGSPVTGGIQGFAQEYNLTATVSIYSDKTTR